MNVCTTGYHCIHVTFKCKYFLWKLILRFDEGILYLFLHHHEGLGLILEELVERATLLRLFLLGSPIGGLLLKAV